MAKKWLRNPGAVFTPVRGGSMRHIDYLVSFEGEALWAFKTYFDEWKVCRPFDNGREHTVIAGYGDSRQTAFIDWREKVTAAQAQAKVRT